MTLADVHITSETLWVGALAAALIDAAWVFVLTSRLKPAQFRQLKWPLIVTAALFWAILGLIVMQVFWDSYYSYFSHAWLRSGDIVLIAAPLNALFAFAFYSLALRLPGAPIVNFFLFVGVESLLEHLWGILSLRILSIPMLVQVSPGSVLAFAVPEYVFYWCIILSLAALGQSIKMTNY